MLVAEVRQDRRVVGDPPDAVGRETVRGGLDDRGRVPRLDHRPQGPLELRRAGRRHVLGVGLAARPDLRLDRPDQPGRQPGGLERGDGEERRRRLAVRAGDPDDARARGSGRRTTTRRRRRGPPGSARRRAAAARRPGARRSTIAAAAPRGRRPGDEIVAVDVGAADGNEQAARVRAAACRRSRRGSAIAASAAGPIALPPSRAPRSSPSAASRSIELAERPGLGRLGRGEHARVDRQRSLATTAPARPAIAGDGALRSGRRGSGWDGSPVRGRPLSSSHWPPNEQLVLVQAVHRLALARLAARAGDVHAAEVHLVTSLANRQLDRPPAEQVEGAGVVLPGRSAWSPEWTVESRSPWRYRSRPASGSPSGPPGLEVDEVTRPMGGAATSRRTTRAARTRIAVARRSRAAGRRSGRGRLRSVRAGATKPSPTPPARRGRRGARR